MPLSAIEFTEIENNRFPFGLSPKSVADTLRKIGDMVESGELCVHSARVLGLAATHDYAKTSIRLVLTERHADRSQADADTNPFGVLAEDQLRAIVSENPARETENAGS